MTISFSSQVKLIRTSGGYYDGHGRYQESQPTESMIYCAIQPASQSELLSLPEGQRTEGAVKIYSESEIKVKDRIEYKNAQYEAHSVEDHSNLFLPHYKAILAKVPDNEHARKTG